MATPTLGVGIIGAGTIFRDHAAAYLRLRDRIRLVGVAEIDAARRSAATRSFFVPVECSDYRDLIQRTDVDVVDVCTPPALHEEMVVTALQEGKYVVCEKPLAHTLAAADRILRTAERHPGKLTVVHQLRYLPEMRKIVWLRDEGLLGQLLLGQFTRLSSRGSNVCGRSSWWGRWDVAGGGAVITQFIHQLDQICHLFGRPVEVTAVADTLGESIESEDTFSAVVRFENGAVVNCLASILAQRYRHEISVFGSSLSVHVPWAVESTDDGGRRRAEAMLRREFGPESRPASRTFLARAVRFARRRLAGGSAGTAPAGGELHAAHFEACLDSIDGGRPLPIGGHEARLSLDLCCGIYTSALTRRPVRLPLDDSTPYYHGIDAETYRRRVPSRV